MNNFSIERQEKNRIFARIVSKFPREGCTHIVDREKRKMVWESVEPMPLDVWKIAEKLWETIENRHEIPCTEWDVQMHWSKASVEIRKERLEREQKEEIKRVIAYQEEQIRERELKGEYAGMKRMQGKESVGYATLIHKYKKMVRDGFRL